jgi:hypothetical protein
MCCRCLELGAELQCVSCDRLFHPLCLSYPAVSRAELPGGVWTCPCCAEEQSVSSVRLLTSLACLRGCGARTLHIAHCTSSTLHIEQLETEWSGGWLTCCACCPPRSALQAKEVGAGGGEAGEGEGGACEVERMGLTPDWVIVGDG